MSILLYLFKLFAVVNWLCRKLVLITFFILIFGIFAPNLTDAKKSAVVAKAMTFDHQLVLMTKTYLPTTYNHKDISRQVAIAVCLILLWLLKMLHTEILYRVDFFRAKAEAARFRKLAKSLKSTSANKSLQALNNKVEQMQSATRQDRKQLLKDFVNIKKQLEAMGRDLAFLSIDVVDSTGMKTGEDTYVITNDFLEYRQFVESKINAHGCIKSTWTPDGLMACFAHLEDAVKAAKAILTDLPHFNQEVKAMKRDFVLRCGINAGYIYFDDSLPLEQISDKVIDIAGHMQKYAQPNSIFLSQHIIKPLDSAQDFNNTQIDVDGYNAYRWQSMPANNP